eukprot:3438152-Pyramimonas_sp.AAC.1
MILWGSSGPTSETTMWAILWMRAPKIQYAKDKREQLQVQALPGERGGMSRGAEEGNLFSGEGLRAPELFNRLPSMFVWFFDGRSKFH